MKPNLRVQLQDSHSWEARLQYWTSALDDNPNSPAAWRWRVQIRVLKFLLSRYSGRAFEGTHHTLKSLPNFALLENPKPPFPVPIMRRVLGHIVEINKEKPQEPPIPPLTNRPAKSLLDPETSPLAQFLLTDLYDWGKGRYVPRWVQRFLILSRHFPNIANAVAIFVGLLVGSLISVTLYFLLPLIINWK